jgi:hypothetical protein
LALADDLNARLITSDRDILKQFPELIRRLQDF